jgi:hypothetical protein
VSSGCDTAGQQTSRKAEHGTSGEMHQFLLWYLLSLSTFVVSAASAPVEFVGPARDLFGS